MGESAVDRLARAEAIVERIESIGEAMPTSDEEEMLAELIAKRLKKDPELLTLLSELDEGNPALLKSPTARMYEESGDPPRWSDAAQTQAPPPVENSGHPPM